MAARGRGRGRRLMSFSVEAVGISRGESLPPSILQPTPLFPPMEQKPLPLVGGEEVEYMLALKQEFRGAMRSLPFFIQPDAPHTDVERYSDKYHSSEPADSSLDWKPDWRRLPKELRLRSRKPHRDGRAAAGGAVAARVGQKPSKEKQEVLLKLETLEKKEEEVSSGEEEGEEKKKQEEEEAEGEEEYDEEEFEEETDYIMSYFDNGEEFAGDSDDNMDEAIY
ncbi:DNA-directed RNA polymerase III subunit RPC7-like [Myripristis murdjan]|uniref:DNA-directed RNA polymerase III subunit RPC7-like n=1 Tax=Myripristis murdjan TaxID=586833 RepID=UPI001175F0FD|nr:DNA-directed RNA polymerase III subunit RPC7-like [Myripristis murdjan]